MKFVLAIAAVGASAVLGAGTNTALAGPGSACLVPRLFALTPAVAEARLAAADCSLGGISFERPRTRIALITDQVPAPGAILSQRSPVSLLAS